MAFGLVMGCTSPADVEQKAAAAVGDRDDSGDCRVDQSCTADDDPATPGPLFPPGPTPPAEGCAESYPSSASPLPYRKDAADWLREANRNALAAGFAGGFVNFQQADYGHGVVYGTYYLRTQAVAGWQQIFATDLGGVDVQDVPRMMKAAHLFARRHGWASALPTFEAAKTDLGLIYNLSVLSNAAVEVHFVDECQLGSPSGFDVEAFFRGADEYARRNGYEAAFPTFERINLDTGGMGQYIVVFRPGYTSWRDSPRAEIDPSCGRVEQPSCAGRCAPGHMESFGVCVRVEEPPPCGEKGERCCRGNTCDGALECQYVLFNNHCVEPRTKPFCGDGVCQAAEGSENCDCEDCAKADLCQLQRSACKEGELTSYRFCVRCESEFLGAFRWTLDQPACSQEDAQALAENGNGGCEVKGVGRVDEGGTCD
ncbi:MAG: hypothetical protein U1E65_04015 [Myxococcota bacterium]